MNPPASAILKPLVGIIMGSKSDWETMRHADETLDAVRRAARVPRRLGPPHARLVREYASTAEAAGLEVIIAGAGGAAHLPGMAAAQTVLPVLGVPVQSQALQGLDSLLSIVQMPGGVPVGTLAIGKAGRHQRRAVGRQHLWQSAVPNLATSLHEVSRSSRPHASWERRLP